MSKHLSEHVPIERLLRLQRQLDAAGSRINQPKQPKFAQFVQIRHRATTDTLLKLGQDQRPHFRDPSQHLNSCARTDAVHVAHLKWDLIGDQVRLEHVVVRVVDIAGQAQ